jgi:hypothetical protein
LASDRGDATGGNATVDRHPSDEDVLLDVSLHALAVRLNADYLVAGAPYGEDEAGLREWLCERWPAPPVA